MTQPTPKTILIIKPSSLGDVVSALPLLTDIKTACPAATIDWLVHPAFADLLRGHQALRDVILFDRTKLAGWFYNPTAAAGLFALRRRLRAAHYDCVIDAQGLLRSALFAAWTRAPLRIGFAHTREGARWFYTHRAELPDAPEIAVVRMRALLTPLGIDTSRPAHFAIPLQPDAMEAMMRILGPNAHPVVVLPGARWPSKRWPTERFTEIVRRLLAAGHRVVLAGSADERELCDEISRRLDSRSLVDLAGETTLAQLIALLAHARLVIANDSGPLHVAAALGRPVVGLYGPTDPRFVGPYAQPENVVQAAVDCRPCRRKTCAHHSCMANITVASVWQKVEENLRQP